RGNRASLDFFNAATKDVDLSLQGEVDFQDTNDLGIKITGATPIFDLTLRPIDCVGKIEIGTVTVTLAPVVAELEFRGRLFQSDWTIGLREQTSTQSFTILNLNGIVRQFPLCFSVLSTGENCKSTAASCNMFADSSVTPLLFLGANILISWAVARRASSRLSRVPLISTTRPATSASEIFR